MNVSEFQVLKESLPAVQQRKLVKDHKRNDDDHDQQLQAETDGTNRRNLISKFAFNVSSLYCMICVINTAFVLES